MALSECISVVDEQGRELLAHGTALFPVACYYDDLEELAVPSAFAKYLEEARLALEGRRGT